MKFSELNLRSSLNQAIVSQNFVDCTPVQEMAIPYILEGKDVAGLAQTGTGKTAAYLLPLMERILRAKDLEQGDHETHSLFKDWKESEYILVLVPTRELAEQVFENCQTFGKAAHLKSIAIYGGTPYEPQKKALQEGVQFVIATPGRLIDLYKEHVIDFKQVRAVVFDEADRLFDMGFKDDAKYILRRIPDQRQFLVFSATLNFDVLNVAYQFGANPIEININKDRAKADHVMDKVLHIGQSEKPKYLLSLLKTHTPHQAIVFSNFKNHIERIVIFLTRNGVPAMGISSLLTQAQRNHVMQQFKSENDQNILVATDVAARGLDIKGVDMIINFDLPDDPENYVHRIGRTGRAGEEGLAFSVVSDRDVAGLGRIESYLENKIETSWMEDDELIEDFKPYPSESEVGRRFQFKSREKFKGGRGKRNYQSSQEKPSRRLSEKGYKNSGKEGEGTSKGAPEKLTHRDRRMGRHKKSEGKRTKKNHRETSRENNNKNKSVTAKNLDSTGSFSSKRGSHSNRDSHTSKDSKRRKVYRYRVQDNQPQSMGQKVSGLIKKLFS